jgi:hypothetical protein
MNSSVPNTHVLYSVEATAWLLGMPKSEVHRAIRIGALHTVRRGGVRLVPAYVLVRLLGDPLPEPSSVPPDPRRGRQSGGAR